MSEPTEPSFEYRLAEAEALHAAAIKKFKEAKADAARAAGFPENPRNFKIQLDNVVAARRAVDTAQRKLSAVRESAGWAP